MAFRQLPEANALAAANKRIQNILKKSGTEVGDQINTALFEEESEQVLFDLIQVKRSQLEPLMQGFEYEQALVTLADLRDAVDQFFDKVMVMAEDTDVKNNRLALLKSLGNLFLQVADISRLQE